jgi:hypothetical protein
MEKYHRYIFIDDHEFYKNLLLKRKKKKKRLWRKQGDAKDMKLSNLHMQKVL